mgnify:CR=1 FL=1
MAGIRLSEAGNAIVYPSVPWAHNIISIKRESFPKGAVPEHLRPYLFKAGGIPAECARETAGLKGAARVTAMNACVSARKGR